MKILFLSILYMLIARSHTFSQCPAAGLKIQSLSCDSPRNLGVSALSCSMMRVKWQGSQNQSYSVNAKGVDLLTGQVYESSASQYSCDSHGNCQATIPVRENSKVTWTVQGGCIEGANTLAGRQSGYGPTYIPPCQAQMGLRSSVTGFRVYPNPSTGDLTVLYNGDITPGVTLAIFDITGKKVLSVSGQAITRAGDGIKLDLHDLPTGNYVLWLSNGKEEKSARFVLIRD